MDPDMKLNLYELIDVPKTASIQEIKKAYRKKALRCHPDKNPNNPRAAELFHELSRALEILTDTSARAAYDRVIDAKHQAKLRTKEFDSRRKKLKEDLEARENACQPSNGGYNVKSDKDKLKLQAEIERLQKEGSKQLEEEIARMQRHLGKQSKVSHVEPVVDDASYKIKLKWASDKNASADGGYNYDTLHRILSKYGDITALIISSTREGRALVEYRRKSDAEMALTTEIGLAHNPLKLQKLWYEPKEATTFTTRSAYNIGNPINEHVNESISDSDFEHSVLSNLRKAEERKRSLAKSYMGGEST